MSHHDEGKHVTGDYTSAEITEQMLRRKIDRLERENEHLKSIYAGLEKAYQQARSAAAGLTNYCEVCASSIRCEKELEQAEKTYIEIKPALTRVKEEE